jgi:hypothetical protein
MVANESGVTVGCPKMGGRRTQGSDEKVSPDHVEVEVRKNNAFFCSNGGFGRGGALLRLNRAVCGCPL